jgi:hypothetical protein
MTVAWLGRYRDRAATACWACLSWTIANVAFTAMTAMIAMPRVAPWVSSARPAASHKSRAKGWLSCLSKGARKL